MHMRGTHNQEYVNGQLKNKYGDAFIRGNNGARAAGWRPACSTACSAPTADVVVLRVNYHVRVFDVGVCLSPAVLYISTSTKF